jgi:hypothetical protein
MRLLKAEEDDKFSLVEFIGDKIPRYAILSHTWGADGEEATYEDLRRGTGKGKAGYQKIRFCGKTGRHRRFAILLGRHLLHIGMSPVQTIPYKSGCICRRK